MQKQDRSRKTSDKRDSIGEDLLIGAEAIALELNWLKANGEPHKRRVYHLAEKGGFPVHKLRGLGLCASKSALKRFFTLLDEVAPVRKDD